MHFLFCLSLLRFLFYPSFPNSSLTLILNNTKEEVKLSILRLGLFFVLDLSVFWYYTNGKVILKCLKNQLMPKITTKGQVTIPQDVRNRFALLPGTEINFVTEGNKVFIVRSRRKNAFLEWLGKGKLRSKEDADLFISQLRGRTDE